MILKCFNPPPHSTPHSEVVVIGSPPHLTLRLRLKNVEQQDEGTWRMRLDNGFTRQASVPRQADVDFTLRVASREDNGCVCVGGGGGGGGTCVT